MEENGFTGIKPGMEVACDFRPGFALKVRRTKITDGKHPMRDAGLLQGLSETRRPKFGHFRGLRHGEDERRWPCADRGKVAIKIARPSGQARDSQLATFGQGNRRNTERFDIRFGHGERVKRRLTGRLPRA